MAKGDCFKVVHDLVVPVGNVEEALMQLGLPPYIGERSLLRACHGVPIARHGRLAGQRHWHAWVEVTVEDGVMVVDISNDRKLKTTRDTFYELGTLTEDTVWRFTPKEARRKAREFGTAGPWVENWKEIADV